MYQLNDVINALPGFVCILELNHNDLVCKYISNNLYAPSCDEMLINVHKSDKDALIESIKISILDMSVWEHEFRLMGYDNNIKWCSGKCVPIFNPDGSKLWVGYISDITEKKLIEEELKSSNTFYTDMFRDIPISYQSLDVNGIIIDVNDYWLEMLGYNRNEVIGKKFTDLLASDVNEYNENFKIFKEMGFSKMEFKIRHYDGSILTVLFNGKINRNPDKSFKHTHGVLTDITQQKNIEEQIKQLAYYDTLTNLPNRRMMEDRLNFVMDVSARTDNYGAVLFIDLDNFKILNDTQGHSAGDLLLIEVAKRITKCVRKIDLVSRFGGDEFVVLLSELNQDKLTAMNQANIIANKILTALSTPYELTVQRENSEDEQITHHCTASIGIATFLNRYSTREDILRWADSAMYVAKNDGRCNIKFYKHNESDVLTHKYFQNSVQTCN